MKKELSLEEQNEQDGTALSEMMVFNSVLYISKCALIKL